MIPVGPIIWIAIALYRYSQKGDGTTAAAAGVQGAAVDGRSFVLLLVYLPVSMSVIVHFDDGLVGWMAVIAVFLLPRWLPWRVFHGRSAPVGSALLEVALFLREGRRERALALHRSLSGIPLPSPLPAVDAAVIANIALVEDAEGRSADADRTMQVLEPHLDSMPALSRRIAFEGLAWRALQRGEWDRCFRRASFGRGRGGRFLRLLARAHLRHDVPAPTLWWAWLLAPWRWSTRVLVRDVLQAGAERQPEIGPPSAAPASGASDRAWTHHVRLLAQSAGGSLVSRAEIATLANAWDAELGRSAQARLHARALELGSRNGAAAVEALTSAVRGDLMAMAESAVGAWPEEEGSALLHELVARDRDALHAVLEPFVAPFRDGVAAPIGPPLAEWECWLAFQGALDRLEETFGQGEVGTAWYGGARLAAWNRPCRVLAEHGEKAAWACAVMFDWTAQMAERLGDEEAVKVNRSNVSVARGMIRA